MDKQRKWQLFLILAVIALTIYNILPTVFYYCKPLKEPIGPSQGEEIAHSVEKRVNDLEQETKEWLASFCELLNVKPSYVSIDPENPQLAFVGFTKKEEAARFQAHLPRAGSLIPFAPAQLGLISQEEDGKDVWVQRRIPIHSQKEHFTFTSKRESDGSLAPLYKQLILDRAAQIGFALAGPTESAYALASVEQNPNALDYLASQINTFSEFFEENGSIASRFAASLTQGFFSNRDEALSHLISAFDSQRDEIKKKKNSLENPEELHLLEKKEIALARAGTFLKKYKLHFASGENPWTLSQIQSILQEGKDFLSLENRNPLFSELTIDWTKEQILLKLHPDVASFRAVAKNKDFFEQLLINEVAKITRFTQETLTPGNGEFTIALHQLPNTQSFLVLNLEKIGQQQAKQITSVLQNNWNPKHPDLQSLKIVDYSTYQTLPLQDQALSLIVCAPTSNETASLPGFRNNSIYVIAKGIDRIAQSYEQLPDSDPAQLFSNDFRKLAELLKQNGFHGYRGSNNDYIFERSDFYRPLLAATRENFAVHGTQKFAYLEFSDLEQRLVAANKIETLIHEDLLKWKDEFHSAQISLHPGMRFDVPKPTKSVFWSNLNLSLRKLFRGDERKIIRWGLDLSGGKTVQIELRDANNQVVKNEADLKQGINELYNRVNKMGVSEVSIRQVGTISSSTFPALSRFLPPS